MSYIIDAIRVPTGKANGYYKDVLPEALAAHLFKHFREKYAFLDSALNEVLLGNAIGTGGNMARYATLLAGFSQEIPATTVDMQCGSAHKAILLADAQIKSLQSECLLVGGLESNSLSPRKQYHQRDPRFIDENTYYSRASFSPENDIDLTLAAENVAKKYHISKQEMMLQSIRSHALATQYEAELSSLRIPFISNKSNDQTIKKGLTIKQLEQTQSHALIDHTNTAHLHDAAAIALMVNENFYIKYELKPKAKIINSVIVGGSPAYSPMGMIWATEKLFKHSSIKIDEVEIFEINESFAVKPLAFSKHFAIPIEKINILGGNLAYGHPFGASGAINLIHLMKALELKNKKYGLLSAGIAGGLGVAILLENCQI